MSAYYQKLNLGKLPPEDLIAHKYRPFSLAAKTPHLCQSILAGKKYGKSVCTNCNQKYALDEMPSAIKLAYYELKETAKTPIWFYIGTISIKVLVLIKIFSRYI